MNDRGKSHRPNTEVVLVLVFVCSTCAAEEVRDFMLCSNNLSSSSTLRASLLVGAPYARKPQSFKPQTACKYGQHIQKEHRTHCSNADKSNTMCINAQSSNCWNASVHSVEVKVETSYLSESSARSSVRSRSPSMMTSLRATFRCSTTKVYNSLMTVAQSGCLWKWNKSKTIQLQWLYPNCYVIMNIVQTSDELTDKRTI